MPPRPRPARPAGTPAGIRHHRVDRDLLDRAFDEIGRDDGDHVVRGAGRRRASARPGPRWAGQLAARRSTPEQRLDRIFQRSQIDAPASQDRAAEADPELVEPQRILGEGATAGSPRGKVGPESLDARERLPLLPRPPDDAFALLAPVETEHRRHRVELELPGHLEVGVVERATQLVGEAGIVLAVQIIATPASRSWASTGATSVHVGQSRLTTTTMPSGNAVGMTSATVPPGGLSCPGSRG